MPNWQAWSGKSRPKAGLPPHGGDVRSEAYAKALVALAVEKFGRLDIAFNNAGTLASPARARVCPKPVGNDAIAINLTGAFLGAKHQIAEMLKHRGGSVIFTSTFVGYSFAFRVSRLCREQIRPDRADAGARRRVWTARRSGQCDPSRRGRDRMVP